LQAASIFSDKRGLIAFATLCCLLWGSAVPAVKFGYGLIGLPPGDTASASASRASCCSATG
jgi:hypothetical protein